MASWTDVLSTSGTLVLVGVTAWYAYLTHRLAQSSQRAAESARDAALASERAAAAAEAQLQVEFSVRPSVSGRNDEPMLLAGVEIRADGATVYVHGCVLDGYGYNTTPQGPTTIKNAVTDELLPVALEIGVDMWLARYGPRPETVMVPELPHRLHRGESMFFEIPGAVDIPNADFRTLDVTVHYSLTGAGIGITRAVHGSVRRDNPLQWNWGTGEGY